MKETWENGNLRIEGFEIKDLEQQNSELTVSYYYLLCPRSHLLTVTFIYSSYST